MLISPAWAQDAAGGAGGLDIIGSFLPLILIFAIFYFLLIRPQQKKQKDHQAKIKAVRRGDRVLTGGGIYGTVTKVMDETEIQVEIGEGMRVRVASGTLMDVIAKPEPAKGGGGRKRGKKQDAKKDAAKEDDKAEIEEEAAEADADKK